MEPFLSPAGGAPPVLTTMPNNPARSTTISYPIPNLFTTREAMTLLRVKTKDTLCGWVRDGKIEAIRMPDGSYRFDEAVLNAWLKNRATSTTGPELKY
jgi:excisionase family DNA binding protein